MSDSATIGDSPALQIEASSLAADCLSPNGSATVQVNSGTAPYFYSWHLSPPQTTATATGLGAGLYQVSVNDSKGCFSQTQVQVDTVNRLRFQLNKTDASCQLSNGSLSLGIQGGMAPYSYDWHDNNLGSGTLWNALSAGTYVLTLTDSHQCEQTDSLTLHNSPVLSLETQVQSANCEAANGEASVSVLTGTAPYEFIWSHDATVKSPVATGLTRGSYTVWVRDSLGCQAQAAIEVDSIHQIQAALEIVDPRCGQDNGSLQVQTLAGTGPFVFDWQSPVLPDSAYLTGLSSGFYQVKVSDQFACEVVLTATLKAIPAPNLSIQTEDPTCLAANGSISLTLIGGTAPYQYSWADAPTETAPNRIELVAGNYEVTLVDSLGCVLHRAISLEPQNDMKAQVLQLEQPVCEAANGSIEVGALDGTAPFTYAWDPSNETEARIENLLPGTYSVTITDSNGCLDQLIVKLTNEGLKPVVDLGPDQEICEQTLLDASDSGIEWYWNTGEISPVISVSEEGAYAVVVTNADGCQGLGTVAIRKIASPVLDFAYEADSLNPFLFQFQNLTRPDGPDTLHYHWDFGDGNTSEETHPQHFYQAAGIYEVSLSVTDRCDSLVQVKQTLLLDPYFFPEAGRLIQLYPNPNDGNFTLSWTYKMQQDAKIQVFNHLGQFLSEMTLSADQPEYHFQFEHLPAGLYHLYFRIGAEHFMKPVMIIH